MALFRRVRIKTEVKMLATEPRNRPSSAAHVDDDDPFSDPELLRMLQAEKDLENELLAEMRLEFEWEAQLGGADIEELQEYEYEYEETWDPDLLSEAAVDQELYEREVHNERLSDTDNSDEEDEEDWFEDYSEDSEEDIDMDYRFS